MKNNKALLFLIAIMITIPFSIPAAASTNNSVSFAIQEANNTDYATNITRAPVLKIRADNDIEAGSIFVIGLSQGAKWSLNAVSASDLSSAGYFSKTGNVYSSLSGLTDDTAFTYDLTLMSEREAQIETTNKLPQGCYMMIPLIAAIDGISEASVSIIGGESAGITNGSYIFANPGSVNEAKIEPSAVSETNGSTVTGSVFIGMSAGLGDTTIELLLPSGFNFEKDYKEFVALSGEGSYSSSKISDIWTNTSQTTLYVKTSGNKLSTSPGRLNINGIKLTALENAPKGEIIMSFAGFGARGQKFKFGEYVGAEEEEVLETSETSEIPDVIKMEINASAASGSKQVTANGKILEMPVAPYIDQNGRLMVPLRFIANAFGIGNDNVLWDAQKRKVSIVFETPSSKREIVFAIGSESYTVDGEEKMMDTTAVIKDGYTFVPVRYVAEAFKIDVSYIPETKTAEFKGVIEQ